jgi:hypothetical protein
LPIKVTLTYRILSIVEPKKEARNFKLPRTSFNAPNLNYPRSIMDKILVERSRIFSDYGDLIASFSLNFTAIGGKY